MSNSGPRSTLLGEIPALTYRCPTCLVDVDEPYCSMCGLDLVHHRSTESNRPSVASLVGSGATEGQSGDRF